MNCARIRENSIPERYLRGELTGGERDDYELHYFSCDACYSELEALRLSGVELSEQRPVPVAVPRGKRWNWNWLLVPVAACAMLTTAVLLTRQVDVPVESPKQQPVANAPESVTPKTDLLVLARYEPPLYRESTLRGTESSGFAEAMRRYQARDYQGALVRLEKLPAEPRSPRIVFYTAACRMLNGDAAGAERGATRSISLGETLYIEESYWLRAKARFALDNVDAAREDLRRVVALKGDWEKKARELLDMSMAVR